MAKRFRFRLEGVRKVRSHERDARRREVANAVRAVTSVEEQIDQLERGLRAAVEQTRSEQLTPGVVDVPSFRGDRFYRNQLQIRILELHATLAQKQDELAACREKLSLSSKRLKAIEKLREKKWLRHRTEINREERTDNDEFAVQRYLRRHCGPCREDRT